MKILKKLGMCAVYFFIGYWVNYFATLFGFGNRNGGNGYTVTSILMIGAVICWVSYYLRVGKVKKEHKGDESAEKGIFNGDLKGKIRYVVSTSDFKIETVIHVLVAAITIMIPLLETAFVYGFETVFAYSGNIIMLVLWMILVPVFMVALNILAWVLAYNKGYKRREF